MKYRLGIDIDDTLVNTTEECHKYFKTKYGITDDELINKFSYDIMHGDYQEQKIRDFATIHFPKILDKIKLKEHTIETLYRLREFCEIYIITSRSDKLFKSIDRTKRYLLRNRVYYDYFVPAQEEKYLACEKYGINLMIDDSLYHLEKIKERGIDSLLFTSTLNKEKETDIERVDNWKKVEEKIRGRVLIKK